MRRRLAVLRVAAAFLFIGGTATAQETVRAVPPDAGGPVTPALVWTDRGDLESQLLRRWAADIAVEGYDAAELAKAIHVAPESRVARAAAATSFAEFVRRLSGVRPAKQTGVPLVCCPPVRPVDLTFVTTTPCRIFDTRLSVAGKMTAGSTRAFFTNYASAGATGWAGQGGDASGCPEIPLDPPALLVTITAAAPEGPGNVKIWTFLGAEPATSNLNFTTVNIANTTSTLTCHSCTADVSVRVTAPTHVVADVVGYFRPKDKTIDTHVTSASLLGANFAVIGEGVNYGVILPRSSYAEFTLNTTLPDDYTPNTDITARFVFTTNSTACNMYWRAGVLSAFSMGSPRKVLTATPANIAVPAPLVNGTVFSAISSLSAPSLGPGDVLTLEWIRSNTTEDTCSDSFNLRSLQLIYE